MERTSSKLLSVSFAKFVQNRRAECAGVCSVASTISGTTTCRVHGGEYRKDRIIRKDELRLGDQLAWCQIFDSSNLPLKTPRNQCAP